MSGWHIFKKGSVYAFQMRGWGIENCPHRKCFKLMRLSEHRNQYVFPQILPFPHKLYVFCFAK